METAEQLRATEQGQDLFKIHGMHHVEFYVGNAKQAAYYYRRALGFRLAGYMGPETGVKDRASYLVEQGKIRFVLTTPLHPDSPMAEHIMKHGDGVRDIALHVENAEEAYRIATERGRYVKAVQAYNLAIRQFPTLITAKIFGYHTMENYGVAQQDQLMRDPEVKFNLPEPAGAK